MTTVTRQELVNEILTYVGTSFQHQGRLPGIGLDCVGVLICAARAKGIVSPFFDYTGYSWKPNENEFREAMQKYLTVKTFQQLDISDIITFNLGKERHAAVVTRLNPIWIVHADGSEGTKKVTHVILSDAWLARLRGVYSFPGVEG